MGCAYIDGVGRLHARIGVVHACFHHSHQRGRFRLDGRRIESHHEQAPAPPPPRSPLTRAHMSKQPAPRAAMGDVRSTGADPEPEPEPELGEGLGLGLGLG
jgi:hypothetical protein